MSDETDGTPTVKNTKETTIISSLMETRNNRNISKLTANLDISPEIKKFKDNNATKSNENNMTKKSSVNLGISLRFAYYPC